MTIPINNAANDSSERASAVNHQKQQAQVLLAKPGTGGLDQAYFRPQVFTITVGINPLTTAAAPLFSLVSKFITTPNQHDINLLHDHLIHEIKAFTISAQTQGYRSETIQVARFAICALLDEIILQTSWGHETVWSKYKLLSHFQQEGNPDERFFIILKRLLQDPVPYIELIEFMYLCLSLGFSGKFKTMDNGREAKKNLLEEVYQSVRLQRGEFAKNLSPLVAHSVQNTQVTPPRKRHVLLEFSIFLLCAYLGLNYIVIQSVKPLANNLAELNIETPHSR